MLHKNFTKRRVEQKKCFTDRLTLPSTIAARNLICIKVDFSVE